MRFSERNLSASSEARHAYTVGQWLGVCRSKVALDGDARKPAHSRSFRYNNGPVRRQTAVSSSTQRVWGLTVLARTQVSLSSRGVSDRGTPVSDGQLTK